MHRVPTISSEGQPAAEPRDTAPPRPRRPHQDPLMSTAEVARAWHVSPKTVRVWAERGLVTSFRTPGGTRRFLRSEIEAGLRGETPDGAA